MDRQAPGAGLVRGSGGSPVIPAGPWATLAVTLAIQAMVSMAVFSVPVLAPELARLLGVSPSLVGPYVAIVYVGAIMASTLAGPLVLRYGALRVSQCATLLCAAGLALLATVPSIPAAIIGGLLVGLGCGPITPASSHMLARSTPAHRVSLVFSVKQTGVPLGGILAGALAPPLLIAAGLSFALWSVAAACVVCVLLAQPLRGALDADREPSRALGMANLAGPISMVLRHPPLARLAASSFVFSAMQMSLATYLVTYLNTTLGYSLVQAGAALAFSQVGGVAGRILWGWIADRWLGALRMLAVVAAIMAVCAVCMSALGAGVPPVLLGVLLIAFGASATGWNGVYLAEVARQAPPGMASTATGGSLAVTFFGVVLGPLLFGGVAELFGSYRVGYVALAIPAAYCAWRLARPGRAEG